MRSLIGGLLLLLLATLGGCERGDREVTVSGTRRLTLWDQSYPMQLKDRAPDSWRRIPATMLRPHNFRFGEGDAGEVYLSVTARGEPLGNLNRWRKQFGQEPLAGLEGVERVTILGAEGYLVEVSGTYTPGMGRAPRPGMAMRGAVVALPDRTVTVKMVGPEAVLAGRSDEFLAYCRGLAIHNPESLPNPGSR